MRAWLDLREHGIWPSPGARGQQCAWFLEAKTYADSISNDIQRRKQEAEAQ